MPKNPYGVSILIKVEGNGNSTLISLNNLKIGGNTINPNILNTIKLKLIINNVIFFPYTNCIFHSFNSFIISAE